MSDARNEHGVNDAAARVVADAARRIGDGEAVDWPGMESSVSDTVSRDLLDRLHDLEGIASFHRAQRGESPATPQPAPVAWGALRLEGEIGRGSFGRVYRAWDAALEREVALKIIDHAFESKSGRAVIEEGRRLARLRHRNIVSIHRAEQIDGALGLEMELIKGRTLAEIVTTQGPFAADEAALICRDVSRALAAVHKAGLVHRDVKAQNVIREEGGRVVLMDFGAGRPSDSVTASGMAGTPLYLAPEVLAGAPATPQSDLYSLGVLLYYLVSGSFPFQAGTLDELQAAHASGEIRRLRDARPDLPEPFIHLVERALEPNPRRRLESAAAFEAELSRVLGSPARPVERRPVSRYWPIVAIGAGLWAAIATASAMWPATPPVASAPADQSIAVLPFIDRAGGEAYFADGMTDELIAMLAKVPGLRVAARTSAFAFKGKSTSAAEIARQLGVERLLEGTVRRTGTSVRVTASLINAKDGLQTWSESFESPVGDVFAVQDSLARAVISHLSLHLGGPALRASRAGRTDNPEAHDLYLRGLASANRGTEPDLRRALELYERAIERDPRFARPYSGASWVHMFLADAYEPSQKAYAAARAAALAAIERDDLMADAHASLAYSSFALDWDANAAVRRYERAIELDPNSSLALAIYGVHLCGFSGLESGRRYFERSAQLDPLSPLISFMFEWCAYMEQDHRTTIEAGKRTKSIDPNFWHLEALTAAAYRELGDYEAAIREYQSTPLAKAGLPQFGLAFTYIRMGRTDDARPIVRALDAQLASGQYVPLTYLAGLHGALGEFDVGVSLLQQAFDHRELLFVGKRKLELTALLKDPRALRIIEQAESIWKRMP